MDYSTYLRVQAPDRPRRGGSRESTIDRLARNVAVIFGVDVVDNPAEATWVADFNEVTLGEIGRGALAPMRESPAYKASFPNGWWFVDRGVVKGSPDGSEAAATASGARRIRPVDAASSSDAEGEVGAGKAIVEIPTATLHQFKPDTKAAAVLAGANRLFEPLGPVIEQVLTTIGYLDDGTQIADETRIAAWSSLVLEIYRQQPALFIAAVEARSVQRALQNSWQLHVDPQLSLARSELSGADPTAWEHSDTRPTTLNVLDSSLRAGFLEPPRLVRPSAADDPAAASNDFLLDALCAQLMRYLRQSVDGGLAWVVEDGDRRWVDAYLPQTAVLEALTGSQMTANSMTVTPYGGGDPVPYDPGDESHLRRVLPRVPAVPEMRPLHPRVQCAIIATLMTLHSFFIQRPNLPRSAEETILKDRQRVAELAKRTLGPNSVWALVAELRWAASRARRRPDDTDAAATRTETMRQLASRYERGEIPVGAWADIVVNTSPSLNSAWRRQWEAGNRQAARQQRTELMGYWHSVLDGLGINPHQMLDERNQPKRALYNVTSLLQNYIGVWVNDPDDADSAAEHVELGLSVLLPIRRKVSELRQNTGPYRKTLQILLRGVARQLTRQPEVANTQRLVHQCLELTGELMGLPEWERFTSSGLAGDSDISTAMSMLLGLVVLGEHQRPFDATAVTRLSDLLTTAMRLGDDTPATHPTFAATEVRALIGRAHAIREAA